MGSYGTGWNALGKSPYARALGDDKWKDFKSGKEMDTITPPIEPEDEHKAQLVVVVTARNAGLSNAESKELLEALGIDERVELDGDSEGD